MTNAARQTSCSHLSRRVAWLGIFAPCLLLAATPVSGQGASRWPLTGRAVQTYAASEQAPMHMPTDVAVAVDGSVYVVDGVYDRIVQFDAAGKVVATIRRVGELELRNPVCATVTPDGALWIADTGHERIVVRDADGSLQRSIDLSTAGVLPPVDIAGLLPAPDGQSLWIADNDNHRLLRYDLVSKSVRAIGTRGESLGEFHFPFLIARGIDEELLVTDVLNGRVQRLRADGTPSGSIGGYGVDLGQLYRPKGVAVDAEGNIWVSDGTLNAVQAFTRDGRLIDVLRDDDGRPLRLDVPMGLAFDEAGALYVVELGANRARKFTVTRNPAAPFAASAARRRAATMGPQARGCTVCHTEWMVPLIDGIATELADVPPNPANHPWVSRQENCLGCHDASVGDSRRRVWLEHGHRVGFALPEDMEIPEDLPLADGRIACRTCHSAHATSDARTTIEDIVFLRIEDSPAELCIQCHGELTGGLAHGMHPLASMPGGTPEELVHIDCAATRESVTCLACHTGHGAVHDHLLVLSPNTNDLCLTCHEQLKPELFVEEVRSAHGKLPQLDAAQLEVARGFDSRIGENNELLCTTCHLSHNAPTAKNLLAFDVIERDTCAECHVDHQAVVGSPHDLRTTHPEAVNVAGMTAEEAGACAGCHTAHRAALPPNPTELDPTGRCTNCHAPGHLAAATALGPVNHPTENCAKCHDPHSNAHGHFLAAPSTELCSSCHTDYSAMLGGPHDITQAPAKWPAESLGTGDVCLACHRPHGTEEAGLFRVAAASGSRDVDAACIACHPDADPGGDNNVTMLHPRLVQDVPTTCNLPVEPTSAGRVQIACKTCHNPHGVKHDEYLLRLAEQDTGEELCLRCHVERANIHMIGHAEGPLRAAGFEIGSCRPCHVVHANPDAVERPLLWPKSLSSFAVDESVPVTDHHCMACHREGGPVAPPEVATHPDVPMFNPYPPDSENFMPLFNARGEVDPMGHIACRTCHLTHGRSEAADIPRGVETANTREARARQWHIRTLPAENVCTTCHGFDALRRFIYFHTPGRREGSIEGGR